MGRLSSSRVLTVLSVLCSLLYCSHGTDDIKIDSYEITTPSNPASGVTYNRVTDTSLVFKVTVSSAAEGGDVKGIEVYFARTDNTEIGTAKAAGGDAPTAGDPAVIPSGGGNPVPLAGNTVDLKFDSEADCTAAAKVCVKIKGDVDTSNDNDFDCLNIGTGTDDVGDKNCLALVFKLDTIAVTAPTTYKLNRVQATTLTLSAGLFNADATETTITSYKLYLSDKEDLSDSGTKKSAAIDVTDAPTKVPANADGTANKGLTTGMSSAVKIESQTDCSAYDKLCLEVVYGSNSATGCSDITGKTDCTLSMDLKTGSFSITAPATYKLTTDTATTITFSAAFLNIGTSEVALTSYKLHLSDNVDLSATGAKVSEAIDVTGAPDKVPAGADGTADKGLTTGMTSAVKIESAEDCSAYKWACLKVEPGPLSDCIDVSDNIDCKDSGAGVQRLSLFTALLILMSIVLPFTG